MKSGLRWIPAVLWMAVLFFLSHQEGEQLDAFLPWLQAFFPYMDSFDPGHFAAYFILALTFYYALGEGFANWKGRGIAILLSTLYGLTDEFHQLFVDGRTAQWLDIRNDAIGASLAMLLFSFPPVHRMYMKMLRAKNY